jgi:hypothetical protein
MRLILGLRWPLLLRWRCSRSVDGLRSIMRARFVVSKAQILE